MTTFPHRRIGIGGFGLVWDELGDGGEIEVGGHFGYFTKEGFFGKVKQTVSAFLFRRIDIGGLGRLVGELGDRGEIEVNNPFDCGLRKASRKWVQLWEWMGDTGRQELLW